MVLTLTLYELHVSANLLILCERKHNTLKTSLQHFVMCWFYEQEVFFIVNVSTTFVCNNLKQYTQNIQLFWKTCFLYLLIVYRLF